MIATLGLPAANKLPASQAATGLPTVRSTLTGWFRPLVLGQVTKSAVDGEIHEAVKELACRGVIQPFGPRELKLKPEGQRSWNWQMLHTEPNVALRDDEEFLIRGVRFRVMSQQNWSEYGYITYELVQGYAPVS